MPKNKNKILGGDNITTLHTPPQWGGDTPSEYLPHGAYILAPAALDLGPPNLNPGSALRGSEDLYSVR